MPRIIEMPMEPSQMMLFGQTVDESVPADSDVRALSEVMDLLDWTSVESGYSEMGRPPYPQYTATALGKTKF